MYEGFFFNLKVFGIFFLNSSFIQIFFSIQLPIFLFIPSSPLHPLRFARILSRSGSRCSQAFVG